MKPSLKKLLVAFLVLNLVSGMQSCKKEEDTISPQNETEEPAEGDFPQPNVIDLVTREAIKTIDTTDYTFVFNTETEVVKNFQVGSIMVDSSSTLAPYGYLRKVTAIHSTKGETTVITEQAQLIDIAEAGSIRFKTGRIPQSRIQKIVLSEGVEWVGQKDPNFSVYSFDYKKTYSGSHGEFTVEGHTSLDLDFFFDFDWHWEWALDLTLGEPVIDLFESGVEINQIASIHTEATGAYQLSGEKTSLAEFYFTPWTFMVGPVPVVFIPKIELFLLANGEIVAEFNAGASEEFSGRLGTRYTDDDGWNEISEASYNTDFSAPNMSYAINYDAHIGPQIELLLYGVVGPFANVTAFASLESELEEIHGLWNLDFVIGVQSEVGVTIDIIGFSNSWEQEFTLFEQTLLHYDNEPFGNAIYIENPTNGSEFAIGDHVNFTCSYTGNTPDLVKFYIGPNLVFEDNEAPYEYSWETQGLNEGRYILSVEEMMEGIVISSDETEFFLKRLEWHEIDLSSIGVTSNTYCTDIVYTGNNDAWITTFEGTSGKVLKTSDDGENWNVTIETNFGLMQIQNLNEVNEAVFLTSAKKVFYTNDGGNTIEELEYGDEYYSQPSFQWKNIFGIGTNEEGDIIAVGKDTGIPYQFEVYRADGISHEPFEDYALPHPNEYGYGPQLFVQANRAIVYGIQDEDQSNKLFYAVSMDGGESWTDHEFYDLTGSDILNGASILNEDQWWIAGENSEGKALVLITENGGQNWETVVIDHINGFSSVKFVDTQKGYATVNKTTVNPEPKVYQTSDGGHTWEAVFGINSTYGMKEVTFVGDEKGLVIGQGPVIYRYGIN